VFDRWTTDENGKRHYTQRHTYRPYPDNEGLLSTIPAIATPLIGVLVGMWLMSPRPAVERCAALLAMGVPTWLLGACLDRWLMPINKNLWTPSFVVLTAGLAMLGLGSLFWIVDVKGRRWWAIVFTIFGVNAIAAYALQSLVPHFMGMFKVQTADGKTVGSLGFLQNGAITGLHRANDWVQAHTQWLQHVNMAIPKLDSPGNTSLLGSGVYIACVFVVLAILYVCRVRVKV